MPRPGHDALRGARATAWRVAATAALPALVAAAACARDYSFAVRVQQVAAGEHFTCALLASGAVRCWGLNDMGMLGQNPDNTAGSPQPVEIAGLADVRQISAGRGHVCALRASGEVACWGDNANDQIDTTPAASYTRPVAIFRDAPAAEVAAGGSFTCARARADGAVQCTGNVEVPDPMDPTSTTTEPIMVPAGLRAERLAAGDAHACAIVADSGGQVRCWGGNTGGATAVPADLRGAVELGLGANFSCARLGDGSVRCWGAAVPAPPLAGAGALFIGPAAPFGCAALAPAGLRCWGAAGNPAADAFRLAPCGDAGAGDGGCAPPGPTVVPVAQVAVGVGHACAVLRDGRLWCWGDNTDGQLGDGTTDSRSDPRHVRF